MSADENKDVRAGRRILVADDDPAILRLVATILEKESYSVVTARDGREAYKILQSDPEFTAATIDAYLAANPTLRPELVRYAQAARAGCVN